jgi:hypothetical protein
MKHRKEIVCTRRKEIRHAFYKKAWRIRNEPYYEAYQGPISNISVGLCILVRVAHTGRKGFFTPYRWSETIVYFPELGYFLEGLEEQLSNDVRELILLFCIEMTKEIKQHGNTY